MKDKKYLILIILLATFLRLVNLNQSLWLDEAAQAIESLRPASVLWQLNIDFHPPLFHYLLHFWQYLGTSEWLMRLLPVSFGVATVFFSYLLGKKLIDEKFGLIFALFLSTAPYHIYYSQELRNYSLITLLAVVSYYLLLEKKWKLYTLSLILALYSNYFAVFLIFSQGVYIFLFNKESLKKYIYSAGFSVFAFSPWFYQLRVQLQSGAILTTNLPDWKNLSSILPIWRAIPQTFIKFTLGRITFDNKFIYGLISVILFVIYSTINVFGWLKKREPAKIFAPYLFIPFFLALVVSIVIPINGPWRLLLILPAFYGLLALGIISLKNNLSLIVMTFVLSINISGLLVYYTNPRFQREDWRGAVAFVNKNKTSDTISLFEFSGPFAPYLWYGKNDKQAYGAFNSLSASYDTVNNQLSAVTINANQIFLFQYLQELTDPQKLVEQWLTLHNYQLTNTLNFEGVGFIYKYERLK